MRFCQQGKIRTLGYGSSHGVDLEKFNPDVRGRDDRRRIRNFYGIPEDAVVLSYVGRIVVEKGIRELAAAWQKLRREFPGIHLILCGEIEPHDPVPAAILHQFQSDTRVHMSDGVIDDMPAIYAASDICVLPSYREGLPNVILEASAMRLPVVATRIPGSVDAVVDGTTGILVKVREANELYNAITRLVADPQLRLDLGNSGRTFVADRFSEASVLDLIVAEYSRILSTLAAPPNSKD